MNVRAIVVEDETAIQQGIITMIKRLNLPIEIVGSYFNGQTAFNALKKARPDIVITDVQMPVMSGLELIKSIRDSGYPMEFLVLSGYSDFQYVKESLQMNVHNYLLKPPRVEELRESLAYLCQKVQCDRYETIRRILQDAVRQQPPAAVPAELKGKPIRLLSCSVGAAGGSRGHLPADSPPWSTEALLDEFAQRNLHQDRTWILNGNDPSVKHIVLLNQTGAKHLNALKEYGQRYSMALTMVVGGESIALNTLSTVCGQHLFWLKQNARFGATQVFTEQALREQNRPRHFSYAERNLLIRSIRMGNVNAMIDQFEAMATNWSREEAAEVDFLDAAKFAMLEVIKNIGLYKAAESEDLCREEIERIAEEADSAADFVRRACRCLRDTCATAERKERLLPEVIQLLEDMIHKEYCSAIDFAAFAGRYGYHPVYLMGQFSKACGISPKKLMIKLRMEKAKELLRSNQMPIGGIAQFVGYTDIAYFSRIFKEHTGVSPSVYGQEAQENQAQ